MLVKEENKIRSCRAKLPQRKTESYSNTMLISMDGQDGSDLYGRIIHHNLRHPVPFRNLGELVLKLDTICRTLQSPPSASEFRTLRGGTARRRQPLPDEALEIIPWEELQAASPGERLWCMNTKELIYLHLVGAQHMSLQGRIKCRMTEGEYVCFRSAVELMRLLSEIPLRQEHG